MEKSVYSCARLLIGLAKIQETSQEYTAKEH